MEKKYSLVSTRTTVWKVQDFYITQILREINFEDSTSAKTAVFAILWALNFVHLVKVVLPLQTLDFL